MRAAATALLPLAPQARRGEPLDQSPAVFGDLHRVNRESREVIRTSSLDHAGRHRVESGMRGPTDVSPVACPLPSTWGIALRDFDIQEHMPRSERTNAVSTPR
ncbi:hypothetical protein GCM10009854_18160 [Saccharopolyspora halophila]|uniref:Secreted protein n=1 Tax=Saccharopolyspora halophila TaxID=405551 RepID=A0ABN3G1U7_9PSEU